MFDAYTVKKVMPRLVIAAIAIQLSWPLFTLLIDLVTQIAYGLEGVLYAPFATPTMSGSEVLELKNILGAGGTSRTVFSALFLVGAPLVGAVALGFFGLLSFGVTIFLALLIAFFVLGVRQIIIVVLLVTAPIALVSWILPNTEKFWKLWWESFSKLLLMYPLILLLIAGGKVVAYLASQSAVNPGNEAFRLAIILLAFFAPYFLIPATFKVAGSAFANIAGIMNDRSKGAFDRLRNYRSNKAKERLGKAQAGNLLGSGKEGSLRSKLNTGIQAATLLNRAGANPRRMRANMKNAIDNARLEHGAEAAEKLPGAKTFFANDDAMQAGLEGKGDYELTKQFLTKRGYTDEQAHLVASQALQLRNQMGAQAFGMAALERLPGTGTAYKGEAGTEKWLDDIMAVSGGNKSIMARLVATGKSGFRSAQQYEKSEAGFGDIMTALDMRAGRVRQHTDDDTGVTYSAGQVAEFIHDKAYAATGAQGVVNARNADSAESLAKAAVRDAQRSVHNFETTQAVAVQATVALTQAQQSGDTAAIEAAQEALDKATADVSSAKAGMAQAAAHVENIRESQGHGKRVVTDAIIKTLTRPESVVTLSNGQTLSPYEWAQEIKGNDRDAELRQAYIRAKRDYDIRAEQQNEAANARRPGDQPWDPTTPTGLHGGL